MRLSLFPLVTLFTILCTGLSFPAQADTVSAECEYRPNNERERIVKMPCRVSQGQGFVSIVWNDGITSEFIPLDLENWLYTDKRGGRVQRQYHPGVGQWLFKMEAGSIFVYWN